MLLALGRSGEARVLAEALARAEPDDVDVLLLLAGCRFASGDAAAAQMSLEGARRKAPERADVWWHIGKIRRALGDIPGAIIAYGNALELDTDLAAIRFDIAQLLMDQRLWDEAEAHLVAALETLPTYAGATLALATIYRMTGRQQAAVTLLVDLLLRAPYHFDALVCLGETMLELGRKADAATAFQRVLVFDPEHAAAMFYDGLMLADRQCYREAIARWVDVVAIDPVGTFADRARHETRTATELLKLFGDRIRRT